MQLKPNITSYQTIVAISYFDDYIYYINKDNRSLCKQFRYAHKISEFQHMPVKLQIAFVAVQILQSCES